MRRQDHRSRRPRGHPSRHHHLHPLHGGVWLRLGKLAQRVPEGEPMLDVVLTCRL